MPTRRRRGLAGTREGYRLCRCGHAKVRHNGSGTGRCSDRVKGEPSDVLGIPAHTYPLCPCTAFQQKGGQ